MNATFLTALFWICAAAVVFSQAMILRSTVRAWRLSAARSLRFVRTEWVFAVVPAVALAAVLWLSWAARR